jgi:subtilisin family serine protease
MLNRNLFLLALQLASFSLFAQKAAPDNWYNLDLKKDKIPGVSTERAYNELLQGKKARTVIVAVIDGGTEVLHEDLKDIIWVNTNEIPDNNIDDDKNGYVDDIHGWSFISGPGGDIVEETMELTRIKRSGDKRFDALDINQIKESDMAAFSLYLRAKGEYNEKMEEAKGNMRIYETFLAVMDKMQKITGSENPTIAQLNGFQAGGPMENAIAGRIMEVIKKGMPLTLLKAQLKPALEHFDNQLKYHLNIDFNPRTMVGDNPDDPTERYYGTNRVSGPKGEHGTHVAGIIAAVRNNGKGINGVCANARIMVLRVVPDGDERDKDIANAIRYAVDNGAHIINMSFGKSYSPHKFVIDEAVKYAASKNVLLVHAAGNDGKNTDVEPNYPRDQYDSGEEAPNWIEVGASGWKKDKTIAADFSNYGKSNVDVFAPGVAIYSCIPESAYATYDGTSMACPVTAGVAALVWSYYPQLTAVQLKQVITQSAVKVKGKVYVPGTGNKQKTKMDQLCRTGAIVNAYEAVKLAEQISRK